MELQRNPLRVVSWCCGRVQSPKDVIKKVVKTLNETHTNNRELIIIIIIIIMIIIIMNNNNYYYYNGLFTVYP